MRLQWQPYLLALTFALGATSNLLADGPTFTTIDFPGAATTLSWAINTRGDEVNKGAAFVTAIDKFPLITKDVPGFLVNKVLTPMQRESRVVALEFELPGTGETIWARGEVTHDALDDYFHGQGIRFTGMAKLHARLGLPSWGVRSVELPLS